MRAVQDSGGHVDAVGQDKAHTAQQASEEQGGAKEHQREHKHDTIIPAQNIAAIIPPLLGSKHETCTKHGSYNTPLLGSPIAWCRGLGNGEAMVTHAMHMGNFWEFDTNSLSP